MNMNDLNPTERLILRVDAGEAVRQAETEILVLNAKTEWCLVNATDDCLLEMIRMTFVEASSVPGRRLLPMMQIEAMRRGLTLLVS